MWSVEIPHLCVYLLRDSVLLDPGMDAIQFLSLLRGKPGLEGLKQPQLLPVLCQHLILVPGGEQRQDTCSKM